MHYLQLASFRWPHEHNRECIDETAYQGTISVSVKHILSTPHRSSWTRRESSESESIKVKTLLRLADIILLRKHPITIVTDFMQTQNI